MKKVVVALVCLVLPYLMGAAGPTSKKWTIVLSATQGSLQSMGDAYELRLANVDLSAFSTRPDHDTKAYDMNSFINLWQTGNDNFNDSPPNALLAIAKPGDRTHTLMYFQLNDAKYNAGTKTATFIAEPLKGNGMNDMQETTNFDRSLLVVSGASL